MHKELERLLAQSEQRLDLRLLDNDNATSTTDMHLDIMRTILEMNGIAPSAGRLGLAGQEARRALERVVRLRAVHSARQLLDLGCTWEEAGQRLNINLRTLRCWDGNVRAGLELQPLGRPLAASSSEQRHDVFAHLGDVGPGLGVPALRTQFPDLARAELDEIVKFYRRLWRTQHTRELHRLHWQAPGTVWAMDFTEAPCLIDGVHPYLLALRDLASGLQLLWEPVPALTAAVVLPLLETLFTAHGAPLVLKADNGSAFIAAETLEFLRSWGVFMLFSPPHTPAYNGSIEAANGAFKSRTRHEAEQAGHPELWTSGNVEAARQRGNATAPAKGADRRTPDEKWSARQPVTRDDRSAFQATVATYRDGARLELHLPLAGDLTRAEQAKVDRKALPRALRAHGHLLYTRRRIPAQIPRPKVANRA